MQGGYYLRGKGADKYAHWPHSGQGGAFRTIGPTKIGVFTVINALGTIVDRNGRVVRCQRNSSERDCPFIAEALRSFPPISDAPESRAGGPTGNTTLTLIVTNQKLPFWALQRLAVQVHGSMNRAIQPFATEDDGDVLYAVTTDEIENATLSPMDLGVIASEMAWDAVISSVPDLPDAPPPLKIAPGADELRKYAGTYDFYGGSELSVRIESAILMATLKGNGRIYFDPDRQYKITPAENGLFVIESPAHDVIRFDESGGVVTGLTINPGPWPVGATLRR